MSNHKEDPKTVAQEIVEETDETEFRSQKVEDLKAMRMEVR